jgi:hypothetical protein
LLAGAPHVAKPGALAAPSDANFGIKGTPAIYDSIVVLGFEVPLRTRGNKGNIKSATPGTNESHREKS